MRRQLSYLGLGVVNWQDIEEARQWWMVGDHLSTLMQKVLDTCTAAPKNIDKEYTPYIKYLQTISNALVLVDINYGLQ